MGPSSTRGADLSHHQNKIDDSFDPGIEEEGFNPCLREPRPKEVENLLDRGDLHPLPVGNEKAGDPKGVQLALVQNPREEAFNQVIQIAPSSPQAELARTAIAGLKPAS